MLAKKNQTNANHSIYLALLVRIDLIVGIAHVVDDAVTAIDGAAISGARFARLASERRTDAVADFALIVFCAEIVVVAGFSVRPIAEKI